jgi:hypothetical protein
MLKQQEGKMGVRDDGKFWMVWCPQGRQPTHQHATLDSAESEAQRLARDTGSSFIVLEAVTAFRKTPPPIPPVERIRLDQVTDEIPF